MQENNTITAEPAQPGGCINCGSPAILHGYPNALCESCRESFIKFKIPVWVKFFAAGIGIIFLFSLYKIPENIKMGIHIEKGKTALTEKKYRTAQKELQAVVNKMPDYLEARSYLLIAAFYNEDFTTMGKSFERLKNENIEDQDLFHKVEGVLQKADSYFGSDSINKMQQQYDNNFDKIPDNILRAYLISNSSTYAGTGYAARLFDHDEYASCDSMLKTIIEKDPEFIPALIMMASVKRQENQFDESINYCDKALSLNKESVEAIASKSRTYLKVKKDNEALDLALSSYHMDENNPYAMGSLLLVYHFTNRPKEKEVLLKNISSMKDSSAVQTLRYVMDVINGKEFFRN